MGRAVKWVLGSIAATGLFIVVLFLVMPEGWVAVKHYAQMSMSW